MSKENLIVTVKWLAVFAAALMPAVLSIYCGAGVPLTAPGGATLSMTANPPSISAVNGVSTITVLGFKSSADGGGPLANGTQIYFTTTLGIIEERVEMQNGIAHAYLRSTGVSGTATVVANSGSGATGGGAATTTTAGGGNTTTTPAGGGGGTGGAVTASVQVNIGNTGTLSIVVSANPATVVAPDYTSDIVATVFDANRNPLPNVAVVFSTSAGALASAGSIILTNTLGQAADRLSLSNVANGTAATVTVNAGGQTATVSVTRPAPATGSVLISSVSPTSADPGSTLTLTVSGRGFQPGAIVSFDQGGITVNSRTFVNSETLRVNITISSTATAASRTITVTNPDGSSGTLANAFRVGGPAPVVLSLSQTTGARGATILGIIISGANFDSGVAVSFGADIGVTVIAVSSNEIEVDIVIPSSATTGPRTVTVRNPDGGTGALASAFTVT